MHADSKNEGVFAIDSKPYGVSYEDWTIKYWQWLLSMPVDVSPRTDTTGQRCAQEQEDPVFFLVGAGGGVVERTCTVPAGKAILVPVAHVECSFAEFGEFGGTTEEKLHTCAEEDQSSNPLLFLSVDGREFKELESYRIHSRAFDVNFPSNALFGAEPGPSRAVSDGYWIILEPLPAGEHEIHFKNSLTNPKTGALFFSDDVKYQLIVEQAAASHSIPALYGSSSNRDFRVEINWTSADIGSENTFSIKIMEASGHKISEATYDIMLYKGDQHLDEIHIQSYKKASEQSFRSDEQGSYTLRIENINDSGEDNSSISIPIQATRESPLGILVMMAAAFAQTVIGIRSKYLLESFPRYLKFPF